jgi:N-acetylglucosaminyldiphosphoundecaprenol N-acetyl-beta-D-mannosaminyltransferase
MSKGEQTHDHAGRVLSGSKLIVPSSHDHKVERAHFMRLVETRPHANLLGVQVEALDMERAVARVEDALCKHRKGYVCLLGVHGIMEAQRKPSLAAAYADALITIPDGMPAVWVGRWQGHRGMDRVAGPDLMLEIFQRKEFAGYTHFFYGGKEGIADELSASFTRRFPWARIVGTYTPPFRDLSPAEEEDFIAIIRDLKPDIIWVGISTPKQEQFMNRYLPLLETNLMFGVGAAFDFHTGRIQDCAEWIKRAGLQWFHRLMQDPRHLWRRYLRNNPAFLWQIALQLTGLRQYSTTQAFHATEFTQRPARGHANFSQNGIQPVAVRVQPESVE